MYVNASRVEIDPRQALMKARIIMFKSIPRVALWSAASLAILLAAVSSSMAYESAYSMTDAGKVEVKNLPAHVTIEAAGGGDYFERGNDLFRRLFRYIDRNKISMTVPVEADIDTAAMRFYVGAAERDRIPANWDGVTRINVPARTVVSAGLRGGYNRENFQKAVARAEAWLGQNPGWVRAGEPYAVYWSGPFTPGFMKRSEVHIPVRPSR
jgi:hypothetical protein